MCVSCTAVNILLLTHLELWCSLSNLVLYGWKTVLYFYSNKDWTDRDLICIVDTVYIETVESLEQ